MADLYQYYNTNDDWNTRFRQAEWQGQIFTPAIAHLITSVKLKLWREGAPGPIIVSIRPTDAEGLPTDEILCSGSIDGNAVTGTSPGQWYEITLGAGCELEADTKYAICVRAPEGSIGNWVFWRLDQTTPTYTRGYRVYGTFPVGVWTADEAKDNMFEEWGEEIVVAGRWFGYSYY